MDSTSASYSGRTRFQLPARRPATINEVFLWYSLLPEGKFRDNTSNYSPAASFRIFSIHYSLTIFSLDPTHSYTEITINHH